MDSRSAAQCQEIIGYTFKNPDLLALSLTHASSAADRLESNERLEFLGDAVLGMVVCDELYDRRPELSEGEMTKIKSTVVSRATCAAIAHEMDLVRLLVLGRGMPSLAKLPSSVAAAVLESIIGAIYLDGGIRAARRFILKTVRPHIEDALSNGHQRNYKSLLQQYAQRKWAETPEYQLLDEKGPDHSKCFEIGVVVHGRLFPSAWGISKKQAEQEAARLALIELSVLPPSEQPAAELTDGPA